jgi:hypothetical protein
LFLRLRGDWRAGQAREVCDVTRGFHVAGLDATRRRDAVGGVVPVLGNAVTQEFQHVEALKDAGGGQLTTRY